MKYIKKDLGSYNLHLINTDKYKTTVVRIVFKRKIEKNEITIRNVVTNLFTQSSKNYKTKRDLSIKAQDLYSIGLAVHNSRMGNYISTIFDMNVLNDKYTEDGNLYNSLEFLSDIIFNPDVTNNKFNSNSLDIVKSNLFNSISSIKEDPTAYSLISALEAYDAKSPVSFRMNGYIEDLDKIDEASAYKYYKSMLDKDLIDIFIVGNFDNSKMIEDVKKLFKFRILKKETLPYYLDDAKTGKKQIVAEPAKTTQTKVNIICSCNGLDDYEINYVLPFYSVILGGSTESKLFKNVREKHSLCYSIHSYPNRLDHILIINTGIDRNNFDKCLELIEEYISDMKKGKFDEKDMKVAREFFETSLDAIYEDPASVLDVYMKIACLGTDDVETMRKKIKNITIEEVIKVAKKVKVETVHLLVGGEDDE